MSVDEVPIKNLNPVRVMYIVGVLVILLSSWLWWSKVYQSPSNVFWGMVENNLSTSSVTRHVVQNSSEASLDQNIREQFGALNASETQIILKQKNAHGESVVRSDTIGTIDSDYSRYTSISTPEKNSKGKSIDTKSILGIWGKNDYSKTNTAAGDKSFNKSVFTLLPYGMFTPQQRQDLLKKIHIQEVYSFNSKDVKSIKYSGRSAFVYQVSINAADYIDVMKTYVQYLGIGDMNLDPTKYVGSPPLKAEITVDKLSRRLVQIKYPDSSQSEEFVDQGIEQPITLPLKSIPIKDLQRKVQQVTQ